MYLNMMWSKKYGVQYSLIYDINVCPTLSINSTFFCLANILSSSLVALFFGLESQSYPNRKVGQTVARECIREPHIASNAASWDGLAKSLSSAEDAVTDSVYVLSLCLLGLSGFSLFSMFGGVFSRHSSACAKSIPQQCEQAKLHLDSHDSNDRCRTVDNIPQNGSG